MLVIRRRAGESILIGESVEIRVMEVGPTRVKLGITAAGNIPVLRKETRWLREENEAAARQVSAQTLASLLRKLRS